MTTDARSGRTKTRLLLGATSYPLSLDRIMERAGYARNDGRPLYRRHAEELVTAGHFAEHAAGRTGRHPRYTRTEAGAAALRAALAARPVLRPLTPINPLTGAPQPLPGELTPDAARLLLGLARGGGSLSAVVKAAGYSGHATTWHRTTLETLEGLGYATELNGEHWATALGSELAERILAARPDPLDLDPPSPRPASGAA